MNSAGNASGSSAISVARTTKRHSARNHRPRVAGSDVVFCESPVLACTPIGPLCDARALAAAPLAGNAGKSHALERIQEEDGMHGWALRHANGITASPLYPAGVAPILQTANILDVYAGLLVELAKAEYPTDGRVRIGRQSFLQRIQWCDSQEDVGGHAYRQLDAALEYLAEVRIHCTAIEEVMDLEPATQVDGELVFRILQAYGRVSEFQARGVGEENRPNAGHRADDIVVYFSSPLVRLLRNSDKRVTYRLSHYLAFRRGVPRAFYRFISYLATQPLNNGEVTVAVDDLLGAIGSTLRAVPPAKVRQLLRDTPQLMCDMGLLRSLPQYVTRRTRDGVMQQVILRPSTPPTPELERLLYETLAGWCVTQSVAEKYIRDLPEWVATVVAATSLGMLVVKKTLPGMVIDYCKQPSRDLDADRLPRFQPTTTSQRQTVVSNEAMTYLEESCGASKVYLDGLEADSRAALRAAYAGVNRPDWVVEGLMHAAAHQFRAGWSLGAFLRARGVTTKR
ncbi:MAG TPA: hypothetical protein VFK04_13750 [Gemmatimonadaceae bacterium]|nr:hypothetical protein [Gemmatimonadaceae bacterium]